ncbi:hypothetical protein QJS10_CPA03g01221 [Acorus calamus]|uniref:Uncharacterized protein n=1 Tax=Acorus calamus TaxID=4465 RepID=A0AAV9F8R8_ACOCL|nr:hypothetical protein QJS10_CPA03g01221 [Acorus calamus]
MRFSIHAPIEPLICTLHDRTHDNWQSRKKTSFASKSMPAAANTSGLETQLPSTFLIKCANFPHLTPPVPGFHEMINGAWRQYYPDLEFWLAYV